MAKLIDPTDLLCHQLTSSMSFESGSENDSAKKNSSEISASGSVDTRDDKKLPSTPRPRRPGRMRSKQLSDISSLLSEPATPVPSTESPGSPSTQGDSFFLAGRSPQGSRRLRVREPSDLSGMFAPALPLTEELATQDSEESDKSVPMLIATGHNRKGRIFGPRKNTI